MIQHASLDGFHFRVPSLGFSEALASSSFSQQCCISGYLRGLLQCQDPCGCLTGQAGTLDEVMMDKGKSILCCHLIFPNLSSIPLGLELGK